MTDLDDIRAIAKRHAGPPHPGLPRLHIYRIDNPTDVGGLIYEPVVCLVLQGRKRTFIGEGQFGLGIAVVDLFSILGADLSQIEIRRFNPRITFDFAAIYPDGDRSPLAIAFARELRDVVSDEISDMQRRLATK